MSMWAECLARKENYVEIDRERVDAWGIPVLKIHAEYGDNEKKLLDDGTEQAAEMLEAAGAKDVHTHGEYSVPGFCIHEIGTARMGNNAEDERRESLLPGARRAQYLCDRWRVLGLERLPESDAHHDGDYGAGM